MTEANKLKYNLIQQYLNGSLDSKRMHELEKEALEDPFLAEALEGYAEFDGSVQPHLSLLQRQLEERIAGNSERKNVFYFTWQRISVAAAASLLFISASILFWMKGTNNESRIANNSKEVEVKLTPGDHLGEEEKSAVPYPEKEIAATSQSALAAEEILANKPVVQSKVLSPPANSKTANNKFAADSKAASVSIAAEKAVPAPAVSGALKEESLIASATRTPAKLSARTMQGLAATESYTTKTEVMNSGSLQEIVVSGKAHTVASALKLTGSLLKPLAGWENYRLYLDKNKRLKAPAGEATMVTLIFTVDSLGKADNFKVQRGIDEQYNAEAIRLVKEGPLWEISSDKPNTPGLIQVDFK